MIIKNVKKKCMVLSLVLILAGAIISTIGFGVAGFNYDKFKASIPKGNAFQTIHLNSSGNPWYGLDFGNNINIFVLGDSE